ncbi:MAG: HAMP domain-containing histidine kinase [Ruminococcus sp.]|nr:HAMP domain-containing histidine kinase [Ruminococcus sp.]
MKTFDRLLIAIPLIMLIIIAVIDIKLLKRGNESRQYLVEANRAEQMILRGEMLSLEGFTEVTGVYEYDNSDSSFFDHDSEYLVREINGRLYRIDYTERRYNGLKETALLADGLLLGLLMVIMGLLVYIRQNVLKQFSRLRDMPYQLAKGNLSEPLKENRSRLFGKFVWGLDMLRSELERTKTSELERARKEKTLLLSLSHDIKTPLSAIKLYSKALSRGLFSDKEKQIEAAVNIGARADEIEGFLGEIINNLNNDFMSFEIKLTDFYLSQVIERVKAYYSDKLKLTGTEFTVGTFSDCLISGDPDRLEEVLQNIFENAIKYGDGKTISMSFSDEEDSRLITVSNSGCTLSDQEMTHIFESFWRGSNVGSRQGSGLGLYICSRLMKEMGGDIFADDSDGIMNVTVVCKKCG